MAKNIDLDALKLMLDELKSSGVIGYETLEGTLIDEVDSPFSSVNGLYTNNVQYDVNLIAGAKYVVNWDSQIYECIAKDFNNGVAVILGNGLVFGLEDTGEPFIILSNDSYTSVGALTSEVTHTFNVSGNEKIVKKINEKYMPKEYATKNDIVGQAIKDEYGNVGGEIFNNYTSNKASGSYSHAEGDSTTSGGDYSHAEGGGTTSSGIYSHAEGLGTTSSGDYSHAEGVSTTSSGIYSHAEGSSTIASGSYSHAEGSSTIASGIGSHAEGTATKASSKNQHVQGKFNIEDTEDKYAHIVGNGIDARRSNAHTLDWDGNAWYQGTVEGTAMIVKSSTEGSTKRFKITVDDSGTLSATEITE